MCREESQEGEGVRAVIAPSDLGHGAYGRFTGSLTVSTLRCIVQENFLVYLRMFLL